jgi:nitric oxide reductase NorQ protein
MSVAAIYRTKLKQAIRQHPSCTDALRDEVANAAMARLHLIARDLRVDIDLVRELAEQEHNKAQSATPEVVFTSAPRPPTPITPTPIDIETLDTLPMDTTANTANTAPAGKTISSAEIDAAVMSVMAPLGLGDMPRFQAGLRRLVVDAAKPPREVEKIVEREKIVDREVEKIVERIVEIPAPPPGCRPAHTPTKTGKSVNVMGIKFDIWDAPDAPHKEDYRWTQAMTPALAIVALGGHAFLAGPAGTGKTSAAAQIAAAQHRPFVRINCHQETSPADLMGGFMPDGAGGLAWRDGALVKAIRRSGTLILIDEPSLARPEAQAVLHSVMEPGGSLHIEQTGETVRVAPGVSFMLADNTNGSGDITGQYAGTARMNRALLDRCDATVIVPYLDAATEVDVLSKRTGLDPKHCEKIVQFANVARAKASDGHISNGVSLRRLIAWARLIKAGVVKTPAFEAAIVNTAPHDDQEPLRQLHKVVFN